MLIVGQGIAGSVLHFLFKSRGVECTVLDNGNKKSASYVAAGLINPLTGRKLNLTWKYPELRPTFLKTYHDISEYLGFPILKEKTILRAIDEVSYENLILSKLESEPTKNYLSYCDQSKLDSYFQPSLSNVGVQGYQLQTYEFLQRYRSKLADSDQLIEEQLVYDDKTLDRLSKDYDRVIFCEGYGVVKNPLFKGIALQPAKGEVLIVRIPGLKLPYIFKKQLFFANIREDIYWVGSGYEWGFKNGEPTLKGKEKLIQQMEKVIRSDYEIVDHIAAIRPTTKFRKPILGPHPKIENLFVFNGLGTKGSSLAPYSANILIDYILDNKAIPEEVRYKAN